MRFGERLKQGRLAQQLTQKSVAEQLHVSRQTISSWENENSYPDIDSLLQLSDLYGLSLDTLLREDTGMTDYLRRQDVRRQIWPVQLTLRILASGYLILVVVNFFKPQLKLMNPVVSLFFLVGLLALNYLTKFNRHFGLDERPLLRERHRWLSLYGALISGFILGIGIVSSIKQVLTWAAIPMMVLGGAGLFLCLIVRTEK
ncbi:helix-turn-helix domain-containing protein [Lactiplantibacillus songbeiensis]|uniref:Helix-turn-helix domain-containing protein n=1 Tax=Lactiplantibacillus songbeiensis TaxID=2559920 RepID=A0ABW4C266_9LACO|nr:helix-turn-helix transcriptional regulator [Lactiplantibacillus songbeiensis]